jgi:acyl-coenzyme A thioesterase PaaI-like protein
LLDAIDGAHAAVREVNGQIAYWESEIKNASRAVAMAKATAT